MTNTDAVNLLLRLSIKGKSAYHPGYDWTVEYAKKCKAHFAGVGIDEYLQQFARRESKELFEQRKTITKHVQKSLGAMLDRPFSKAPRSNWTKVLVFDKDQQGNLAKQFEKAVLSRFSKKGLDGYVFERVKYWNKYDPNAFVVVEFLPGGQIRPYPFEVTADMAVSYRYDTYGELEYLACRQVSNQLERLTIYMPRQTLVIQQLSKDEIRGLAIGARVEMISDAVNGQIVNTGDRVFRIDIPAPHNYPATPAIRTGFIENPEDDGATCVSIFDAALPYAEKIVKINSELDLTTALIAFPLPARYGDRCEVVWCHHGKLGDGSTCMACNGTGRKERPTSAAEELVIDMPSRPEDLFDLSKLMHYFSPPTDAVKMQVELMQSNFEQAKEAVFNSQMYTKQQVAQTATYHGIELQSIYDTLYDYAQNLARVWSFLAETCRAFVGTFPPQMTAALIFPQDFRFETAGDLFDELKRAREAEAGNDTTTYLQEQIMARLLIDDRERLERWRVDNALDPFKGMSEAQILFALSSPLVPEWKKTWWLNRGDIMAEILLTSPDFYKMPLSKQRELVMAAVKTMQDETAAAQPRVNIGALPDNNPQPQPNAV